MYIQRKSLAHDLFIAAAVVLLVLAAFHVGDGDPSLFDLGLASFFASFLTGQSVQS